MKNTKKKQPFISNFFLHNSFLEEVNEFRDLGITTDQHLRWNLHIDKVVAEANRMLGLIKRTCRDFDDYKTLRTLYCALVRSKIIDIDNEPYVDFYKETDHYSFRHNDKLTLKMRYARTNVLKYSYFHRVVGTWNSLPLFVREATSVNS